MAEPRTSTPGSPPPPRRGGRGWGWIIGLIVLIAVVWVVIELADTGGEEIGDAPVAEETTGEFGDPLETGEGVETEPGLGPDEGQGADEGMGQGLDTDPLETGAGAGTDGEAGEGTTEGAAPGE